MKRLIIFTLAFALMAFVLFSCGSPPDITPTEKINLTTSVDRIVDYEAGVVCWTFYVYQGGGISCVPIDKTSLGTQ